MASLCAGMAIAAQAAPAGNLFAAEVPVRERTAEAKEEATRLALAQVLVKVSGSRATPGEGAAQILIEDAQSYVQQFRFTPNGTLLVGFDGRKLQNDMRVAGLPVWGSDRPETLVWLAIDYGNGERRLLAADERSDIRNEVEILAASRGIPLIWPLNDSIDRAAVEVTDVWGGFAENITAASARYGAEGVLVARVSRGPQGEFFGSWELHIEGDSSNWRGGFAQSIDRVANFYADRLAVAASSGPAERLSLSITGLNSAGAYAEALAELEKLSVVDRVKVLQVSGERVMLELVLRGDGGRVSRALGLSRILQPDPDSSGVLTYRYAR